MEINAKRNAQMSRKPVKRKSKESGYVARSITIPPDIDAKLNAHAEREERSLSFVITKALRDFFEKIDRTGKN